MPLVPLKSWKTPRLAAAAQVSQLIVSPAPVGGLNYRDPISNMALTDALVMRNFIPKQTGAELRRGWQYHTLPLTVISDIRSLFAYNAPNPANSKLFAAANGNIYNATTANVAPTVAVSGTGSTQNLWNTTQFSTVAGNFLLAVSPGAGYWTYNGSTWTQQTVTGLPANPTSVAVWKNRVWFTVQDSASVYYLDTANAITGTAVEFPMGGTLRNGGYVRGLVNWTLDAGVGIDDYLVVVGSQGDVSVWQGTDPSDPTKFGIKGVWYVGPVPRYGRFFTNFGGDVMLLSELGIVPVSRLVNGQFSEIQPGPAQKIQSVLSPVISRLRDEISWDVYLVPSSDVLVIKLPAVDGTYEQYGMNINTGAWCTFSGMPMTATAMLNGQLYFATDDYAVAKGFYGELDQVNTQGDGGEAVDGELQTCFNAFNTPGQLKRFTMVRPVFIARQPPSIKIRLNTQYSFGNAAGAPSFTTEPRPEWDDAQWNLARWASSSNTYELWIGVTGLGYYGSLRMRIRGLGGSTVFASFHVMSEVGGVM